MWEAIKHPRVTDAKVAEAHVTKRDNGAQGA